MKQLIIDKIDRLVEQGYIVEKTKKGYKIDRIHVYMDSEYMSFFYVEKTDLEDNDSKEIYLYLKSLYEEQFIEYLKS